MTLETSRQLLKESFTAQMRDCMKLCGYTTSGLAKELGCEPSVVSSWLLGKRTPSGSSMLAIASTLGVSVELLLTGKETW